MSVWQKARRSMANGNCAEVLVLTVPDTGWRRSSYETSPRPEPEPGITVHIRDSKAPGMILRFTADRWRRFLDRLDSGQPCR